MGGSLPCDIVDAVNVLKDDKKFGKYFKGITAQVFITERAMANFPELMPLLKQYFGAEVVKGVELPQLEKNERALEWCLEFPHVPDVVACLPCARFYQHIGRYPTETERAVIT